MIPVQNSEVKNLVDQKNLALAAATVWGAAILFATLLAASTGIGKPLMKVYGTFHPGYSVTISGAFVGLVYSFICAFVAIYALAWLYNRLEKK